MKNNLIRGLLATGTALSLATTLSRAQIAVSQITTSYSDQPDTTVNGTTFERSTMAITSFKDAAGNIYDTNSVAGAAYVRRNTSAGNANNSSVWYLQDQNNSSKFYAPYSTDYAQLLLGNNLLRGSDNTFANGTGAQDGNIERLDFVFSSTGIVASATTSFAVFDRGDIGVHDSVKIAVITGWNAFTNSPTAYGGNLVGITSEDYGSANLLGQNYTYNLFRYNNGNNLSTWTSNSETGSQGLGGVTISLADLGIAPGTIIYGYSLMGYDVTTGGNMSNLVNWNNATYYPTNTTNATGSGGIDLSAVNGVLYNVRAPEPSTYGAMFIGASAAMIGWRRWRKRHA